MKRALLCGFSALSLLVPSAVFAQAATTKVVGTCGTASYTAGKMAYPTQDTTGAACSSGGGSGGSASFTAAAAPFAVSAGTNKPAGISTTNSAQWSIPVKPGTTTEIDLSAPSVLAGVDGSTAATVANPVPTAPSASAAGGATAYGLQSAASTNATSVKASAGTLYGLSLANTSTTVYYLRMYNLAAAPTCSSATGFVRSWPIPPAASAGLVGGFAVPVPLAGVAFGTGIAFCVTGGPTSTDNTNAATGLFINIDYK